MTLSTHSFYTSSMMYPKNHGSNLSYPPTASWYSNYAPTHHSNNQFLNGANGAGGPGVSGSVLDSETAAATSAMFYNPHHHHHMLHQSSPDWTGHDSYAIAAQNSQLLQGGMGPASALHLSSSINGHGGNNNSSNGPDNLSNGLQHTPPSPPITVNSGCSEMSSPGIGTNGGSSIIGNGGISPNMNNSNNGLSRPKSPYEWMKKPSYQSQPHPGKTRTKDKYRVVYSDGQRLELEKEYHMSKYITIRRKSELAQTLQLSERQVKIWFQNRRAKERKQTKKRDDPSISASHLSNGISLQHHNMSSGGGGIPTSAMNLVNGFDIKPKLEPGLLNAAAGHHSHIYSFNHHPHHSNHHSHAPLPMHQLSSMGMNLHAGLHMHHSSPPGALPPPPISSPATSSASILQQHSHIPSSLS